jgi:hypothetical protein
VQPRRAEPRLHRAISVSTPTAKVRRVFYYGYHNGDLRPGKYDLRCRTIDANGLAQPIALQVERELRSACSGAVFRRNRGHPSLLVLADGFDQNRSFGCCGHRFMILLAFGPDVKTAVGQDSNLPGSPNALAFPKTPVMHVM